VYKIHPGLSTFVDKIAEVGPGHLQPLLDAATNAIPFSERSGTPIFFMATAGMRMVAQAQQTSLLREVCNYIRNSSQFLVSDCETHVRIITGETEGVYGWLAANYLLGGLANNVNGLLNDSRDTYGFLDMGGASAQIVYAPNTTETEKHADDLKLVRLRNLDGSMREYRVFSASFLGFGANVARQRFIEGLREKYIADDSREFPDPCMPHGLRITIEGGLSDLEETVADRDILVGTGDFLECLRLTLPLLGKDTVCEETPCLFNGKHAPAIDFRVSRFVGISEYWHMTHNFLKTAGAKSYDLMTYQETVMEFCNRDWNDIANDILPRKKDPSEKLRNAQDACFKASWLINILHEGVGIPRLRLDPPSVSGFNISQQTGRKGTEAGFPDSFRPLNKIDGTELSWTLGQMLLYACGQIRPVGDNLPVGLGRNLPGVPLDFEYLPGTFSDGLDSDSKTYMAGGQMRPRTTLPILFLIGLVLALVLICRRERRTKIYARLVSAPRHYRRRCCPRLTGRIFPFARKLFGDNRNVYERILEEGGAGEHSLSEIDTDDSEAFGGPLTAMSSGLLTPKTTAERFEEAHTGLFLGRNGLAARTEGRERLAVQAQILNIGRRSRAGSPARAKRQP